MNNKNPMGRVEEMLKSIAQQVNPGPSFTNELEKKLMNAHKPVKPGLFSVKKIAFTVGWAVALAALILTFVWVIRSIAPKPQPAAGDTPFPVGETAVPRPQPQSTETQPAMIVEELTKKFGQFTAVDRVSFSVREGEVFGWLGPNGAGKTTTIRMLLGLIKPTSGRASVLGYDPARETKTMQAEVGYMSQQFTLYNELTARENIRFYGQVYGLSSARLKQREAELLEMAGLQKHANVITGNLSGGWKQRLALGSAIVHQPRVIFWTSQPPGWTPSTAGNSGN